jgi:hypothetical protein
MVSFDVQDAFHHVAIHPEHIKYFTFKMGGEYWECPVLPFGWTNSPMIFTKVMRQVVAFLRSPRQRVRDFPPSWHQSGLYRYWAANLRPLILPYLDDVLGALHDKAELTTWTRLVQDVMSDLGIKLKPTKCSWEPTQVMRHLGLLVDSKAGLFMVPPDKVSRIHSEAHALLSRCRQHGYRLPARTLASFAGVFQSVSLAVRPARFYLRELYGCLRDKRTWTSLVKVPPLARQELRWWGRLGARWNGRAIWTPPSPAHLAMDSSDFAWGAELTLPDTPTGPTTMLARGFWSDTARKGHINLKELTAIRLAISCWVRQLAGRHVNLAVDSTVCLHVVRNLLSKSGPLHTELRRLHFLLAANDIVLWPRWIPSEENAVPDALSQLEQHEDWQLNPQVFARIDQRWGPHTLDRFASLENRLIARHTSEFWDPETEGVDAFATPSALWTAENNWANPPWSILPRLVRFLEHNPRINCTVLAPWWPMAPWFPRLQSMVREQMVFPPSQNTFLPGRLGGATPVGAPRWRVAAFRVGPPSGPISTL